MAGALGLNTTNDHIVVSTGQQRSVNMLACASSCYTRYAHRQLQLKWEHDVRQWASLLAVSQQDNMAI